MFGVLFGWRKASKCKKLIKRVQCRLKLLKNRRNSILRQLREDVAQLIKIGYEDAAFNRVDRIFKDESIMTVYELLDNFCEFIILHLSYIRRHKDCPNDINEAISSLIFASARCGDLPELCAIRKLFGERYGKRFEKTALQLLPGNLVNSQLTENLSIVFVTDEMKQRLVDKIARDYCLRQEILALECPIELQQQVNKIEEDQVEDSGTNEEGKSVYIDAASTGLTIRPSLDSSLVLQSSPVTLESPMHSRELKLENFPVVIPSPKPNKEKAGAICVTTPERKEESTMVASSLESLPYLEEDMIIYLDEIEELQSSIEKEGSSQDQSIFKFKSSPLLENAEIWDSSAAIYMDKHESQVEDVRSRSVRSTMRVKEAKKRSRQRSGSLENSSIENTDCFVSYDSPSRRPSRHGHDRIHPECKHQKHSTGKVAEPFYAEKGCCLNQPCYFCARDGSNNNEISPWKQRKECNVVWSLKEKHVSNQFDMQIQSPTVPQRPKTMSHEHNHSANPNLNPGKESKIEKGNENGITSSRSTVVSNVSYTNMPTPLAGKQVKPPYLRILTMPQERDRDSQLDNVARSKSFPVQSPTHVHPKLPDYDEIAAKFMALKKEYVQKRVN